MGWPRPCLVGQSGPESSVRGSLIFTFLGFFLAVSMLAMFSVDVKTFPHDFTFFVGSLLGGIGTCNSSVLWKEDK